MAKIELHRDFKELLKLLNSHSVEYLVVGGYAVNYHGYTRATSDLDVWVGVDPTNAARITEALQEFGFRDANPEWFREESNIVRMGYAPVRIEILTSISGVDFKDCYTHRIEIMLDGVPANLIDLENLRANKLASGRFKDLNDLEQLTPPEEK